MGVAAHRFIEGGLMTQLIHYGWIGVIVIQPVTSWRCGHAPPQWDGDYKPL